MSNIPVSIDGFCTLCDAEALYSVANPEGEPLRLCEDHKVAFELGQLSPSAPVFYGDVPEEAPAPPREKERFTIEIAVTLINDWGEGCDTHLSIGPDFAHTDLDTVVKFADMLNQLADGLFTNLAGSTPLIIAPNLE